MQLMDYSKHTSAMSLYNNRLDPARSKSIRNHNLTLIANTLTSSNKHYSRAELARITGLNRSTLTRLVDSLIEYGIISELHSEITGSGRPAVPLTPSLHTYASIGLSLSKSNLEACVIDISGNILSRYYEQINDTNPTIILKKIKNIIYSTKQKLQKANLPTVSISIAISGLMNTTEQHKISSPNLKWNYVDLSDFYNKNDKDNNLEFIPISFIDLAAAGAYAEIYLRNKKGNTIPNFLYIHSGNSIDTALIKNNTFEQGCNNWGGKFGHVFVSSGKSNCSCGHTGCLESFAGSRALIREGKLGENASINNFYAALFRNEPAATRAANIAAEKLGIAISSFINIFDMPVFIFDGIYSEIFDSVKDKIIETIKERAICSNWSSIEIMKSIVPGNASALGAAWKGMNEFLNTPELWIKKSKEALSYYPIQSMSSDI